jgi:SurA N-terminal domain.
MTMTTTTPGPHRFRSLLAGCAVALAVLAGSGSPLHAQSVALLVNGEPITNYDIEQRTKLNVLTTQKQMPRQEVIDQLIDEKVKIKEAKKYGVDPTSSDIEQSYSGMSSRMRITADQLTKSLEGQGIRPDTLKARLRADMVWTSLVRGRFKESLQVGEKEVTAAAGDQSRPRLSNTRCSRSS